MATQVRASFPWKRLVSQALVSIGFIAAVGVLLLWLAGKFERKVVNRSDGSAGAPVAAGAKVVPVRVIRQPRTESAVGTIRAVHETSVGSKLLARVSEVNLKAGQRVNKGDVLIRLDDTDLQAKLQQAHAMLTAAEAVRQQAESDEKRLSNLMKTNAVSRQEYENSATKLRAADADLRRAQEAVKEGQVALDWATLRAPMDGVVIDKKIDVGDMVTPGQILVTLFDPSRMQLVASVRESLAHRLQTGQTLGVRIEGLDKQCQGTISEIVPEAESSSRAFQVKVTGPCPGGIYSGMFGRLLIPLDEETVLVIPRRAVLHVGQLELVDVADKGHAVRRSIRTGRGFGEDVEVLSGLRDGEQVVISATESPQGGRTAGQSGAAAPGK
jgi:RND family efflux transporter MFP subunit